MLNQILPESSMDPRTGVDPRGGSTSFQVLSDQNIQMRWTPGAHQASIKTAFLNNAQSHVSCNTDHTIQDGKTQTSSVQGLLQRDEK